MDIIADIDLHWVLWTLVRSYFLKKRVTGENKYFELFDWNWRDIRNPSYLQKIFAIQIFFQGTHA